MSFVKKAVKKVFSFVKKVVKSKYFKWVAIAALTFFTAGVAAGGFAAFTGVNSVGAFFTAVGQTMATGAASMASGLGFKGAAAKLASHGGAAAIQAGLTTTATSATGAALSSAAATGSTATGTAAGGIAASGGTNAAAVQGGLLTGKSGAVALSAKAGAAQAASIATTTASQLLPGVQATGLGQATTALTTTGASSAGMSSNVWKGIQVGFTAMAAAQARKKDKKGATFVAGGLSKGGSSTMGPTPFFVVGGPRGANAQLGDQDQGAPQAPATEKASVAGTLARQESQPGSRPSPQDRSSGGVLDLGKSRGPAEVPQTEVTGTPDQEGLQFAQGDPNAILSPEQQAIGEMRATSILSPRKKKSFEDRVFGGSLAGV